MARPLRLEFPGALYHVISRGIEKRKIFISKEDKEDLLYLIERTHKRHNIFLHSYCIMSNHYHLLMETPDGNLARAMHSLNASYAQRFNKRHERCGPVFQGRYKALLAEKENYLLTLARYIVLNPVVAMIVDHPAGYKWSSYLDTLGERKSPLFLETDTILSLFSKNLEQARFEYRGFIERNPYKNEEEDLEKGPILGGGEFKKRSKQLIRLKKEVKEIPKKERYACRPPLSELFNNIYSKDARDIKICAAFKEYGYTQKEIANQLGIHYSTVCLAIKRMEAD